MKPVSWHKMPSLLFLGAQSWILLGKDLRSTEEETFENVPLF
jgi:hypothetical protein